MLLSRKMCIFLCKTLIWSGSKTVFFVHGWPLNHQMYQYQLNVLPEHGFRCIAMDIRGNGQSDKPWTGYTYDRLADDIAIVLEALQVENATLVGFSVGGALSIRYMSRYHGRRISKLALIDAVSPLSLKIKSPLTVYRKNKQMLSLIKCMLIYQNF